MHLNLNADLGESFGPWPMGDDENLLSVIDSANVACGFHAGDPLVMRNTIELARTHGVTLGAHPGFADLQGFGRRPMTLPDAELTAMIQYQLAAIDGVGKCLGLPVTHVKPHGALNNMACEDRHLADVIVKAVVEYDKQTIFLAPVLSELAKSAQEAGLSVALEVFADRAYTDTGSLVSRRLPGAVLQSAEACIEHVTAMIRANGVVSQSGKTLPTPFHSICVHGDNSHAVDTARRIKKALISQGHTLTGLPKLLSLT